MKTLALADSMVKYVKWTSIIFGLGFWIFLKNQICQNNLKKLCILQRVKEFRPPKYVCMNLYFVRLFFTLIFIFTEVTIIPREGINDHVLKYQKVFFPAGFLRRKRRLLWLKRRKKKPTTKPTQSDFATKYQKKMLNNVVVFGLTSKLKPPHYRLTI